MVKESAFHARKSNQTNARKDGSQNNHLHQQTHIFKTAQITKMKPSILPLNFRAKTVHNRKNSYFSYFAV